MTLDRQAAQRQGYRAWEFTQRIGLHEVVVVVAAFLVYFAIRGAVVDREADAIAHARDIIGWQKAWGINWEHEMQSGILGHYWLIKTMNWIYFWGHMPLVIVFAIWLYAWHRKEYVVTRNAFLTSGAIAVVVYWLWPVAPPRLIPDTGLVDTMAIYDRVSYNAQEAKAFVNPYAAVPSLHFGWSMLLGFVVAKVGRNLFFVAVGLAWPVAMFFAIVMTGNHFIFDAITGAIVSFAGLGVAVVLDRYRVPARRWVRNRLGFEQDARGEQAR